MRQVLQAVLIAVTLPGSEVAAFELNTHRALTAAAIQRSVLARDPSIGRDFGVDLSDASTLSALYYDIQGHEVYSRRAHAFEEDRMGRLDNVLSAGAWILRGSIREDDVGVFGCAVGAAFAVHNNQPYDCNPRDARENIDRVLNHFFDPVRQKKHDLGSQSAVDWALGVADAFGSSPNTPLANRKNHFSVIDARRAMYAALSGRGVDGKLLAEDERKAYWATMFRAVGDVAHLVQDMAQPQHTRDESHPGSVFEDQVERRIEGGLQYTTDGAVIFAPALDVSERSYALPKTFRYRDLWSSGRVLSIEQRSGLSDYSNRGFFTELRNFGDSASGIYDYPSAVRAQYQTLEETYFPRQGAPVTLRYLSKEVPDVLAGPSLPIRMTAFSTLNRYGQTQATYSITRRVIDDQVSLLVPRAVAYSAAAIDYFFRGRIDCVSSADLPAGCRVKNLGTEPMTGSLELYYDADDGTRRPVPGGIWNNVPLPPSDPNNAGDGYVIQFQPPSTPAPKSPGEYILVFRGTMGEETSEGEALGMVTGKVIGANTGRLYVLAVRNGQLVTLVTDNGETRQLESAAFDPLQDLYSLEYSYYYVYRRYQTVNKAYLSRQVKHAEGIFTNQYKVQSLVMIADYAQPYTYVATNDPAWAAIGYKRYSGVRWLAQSGNSAIGDFVFSVAPPYQIAFERTFLADGKRQTATGTIPLTSPYASFVTAFPVVSGDGLSVGEVFSSSTTGSNTQSGCVATIKTNTSTSYYDLRVSLALVPTVSHLPLETLSSASTSIITYKMFPDGSCAGEIDITSGGTSLQRRPIGYVKAKREVYRSTSVSSGTGVGLCGNQQSTSLSFSWTTSGGAGAGGATCHDGVSNVTTYAPSPDKMLDGQPQNMIWFSAVTSREDFRGIDVTNQQYVRDVSPLGEVFFATPDMSTVIHEPTAGRPRFTPPPGTTQVLAAMWM